MKNLLPLEKEVLELLKKHDIKVKNQSELAQFCIIYIEGKKSQLEKE